MRGMGATLVVLLVLIGTTAHVAKSQTDPDQYEILVAFRDAMINRPGGNWSNALASWTCPTEPGNSISGECDPCGAEVWGNWEHIACRGKQLTFTKWAVPGEGKVTNVHITDYNVEGRVPIEELCPLKNLREFDLDGGKLEGPVPSDFADCFPELREIDLSYNTLSGELPERISETPELVEFKVENNQLSGTIPESYGSMKKIAWFRFAKNSFTGKIPSSFVESSGRMNQLTLDNNNFEGNLYPLSKHRMVSFTAHNNPNLCGMVPVGVRFAHGFNYWQTNLGLPCPGETA